MEGLLWIVVYLPVSLFLAAVGAVLQLSFGLEGRDEQSCGALCLRRWCLCGYSGRRGLGRGS